MTRWCLTCGWEAWSDTVEPEFGAFVWWVCSESHQRKAAAAHPFAVKADGTVVDRQTGEVCGEVWRCSNHYAAPWTGLDMSTNPDAALYPTRTAAAEALYEAWKSAR